MISLNSETPYRTCLKGHVSICWYSRGPDYTLELHTCDQTLRLRYEIGQIVLWNISFWPCRWILIGPLSQWKEEEVPWSVVALERQVLQQTSRIGRSTRNPWHRNSNVCLILWSKECQVPQSTNNNSSLDRMMDTHRIWWDQVAIQVRACLYVFSGYISLVVTAVVVTTSKNLLNSKCMIRQK